MPYWSRWTGDEGLGIPTELMGMIVPIERWVAEASAATLTGYTRSAPMCLGDCYWLEAVVLAIDAAGKTSWEDVPALTGYTQFSVTRFPLVTPLGQP